MDIHDKVGNAEINQGGVYFLPGLYPVVQVDVIKLIKSRHGDDLVIVEFDILVSEVPNRPAGSRATAFHNFSKHDAAPGNFKALLAAITDSKPENVDAKTSRAAMSDAQPAHGRLVRLEAVEIITKAGNPFTKLNWYALDDSVQAKAEELRKKAISTGLDNGEAKPTPPVSDDDMPF